MGRGRPIDQSRWPGNGPRRTFFELLDKVHRDNGTKSLADIAAGMNLSSRSRVSEILRGGTLPVDESQVRRLIIALGGGNGDVQKALSLYRVILSSPPSATASPARHYRTSATASPSRHYRIFLCHSSGDKRRVRRLFSRLREKGFDPWLDEENIVAGQDWDAEIKKAVRAADLVIVCLSKASIGKTGYVQREIRMVLDLADEQPEGKIYIIPAKLEACEVPDRLSRWQWVALYRSDGYERLFAALASASINPIDASSSDGARIARLL